MFVNKVKIMEGVDDVLEEDNAENLEEKCDGTVVAERSKKKKKKKKSAGIHLLGFNRFPLGLTLAY